MSKLKVIAHRGMGPSAIKRENEEDVLDETVLPENTLLSFKEALDMGADGLEFDIGGVSSDGVPIVIHSEDLNHKIEWANPAGGELGKVSDYPYATLQTVSVGQGQTMPSLHQVLNLIAHYDEVRADCGMDPLVINIELKGENCEEAVSGVLDVYETLGRVDKSNVIVNSFKWDSLKKLSELDPSIKTVPNVKTKMLFADEDVGPGFEVRKGAKYKPDAFDALGEFVRENNSHAIDCVVFDIRDELIEFCEKNDLSLFTSTSQERTDISEVARSLRKYVIEAAKTLPVVYFKADHVGETQEYLESLMSKRELRDMRTDRGVSLRGLKRSSRVSPTGHTVFYDQGDMRHEDFQPT